MIHLLDWNKFCFIFKHIWGGSCEIQYLDLKGISCMNHLSSTFLQALCPSEKNEFMLDIQYILNWRQHPPNLEIPSLFYPDQPPLITIWNQKTEGEKWEWEREWVSDKGEEEAAKRGLYYPKMWANGQIWVKFDCWHIVLISNGWISAIRLVH